MEKLQKYSIELLASLIGDRILFEDRNFETWHEVEICFKGMNAFITGVMYSDEDSGEFSSADLSEVILQETPDYGETVFEFDKIIELEGLIKKNKS